MLESPPSQPDLLGGYAPVAIALGSNLPGPIGEPHDAISWASRRIVSIPGVSMVRLSTIIRTEPVGPPGQPSYCNAALTCLVDPARLAPRALLGSMLDIEREAGRDRATEPRWGPRTLDLDLLLYADCVIDEPGLTVPHPRMLDRLFVLQPLAEIAPDWVIPLDAGANAGPTPTITVESALRAHTQRDPSP